MPYGTRQKRSTSTGLRRAVLLVLAFAPGVLTIIRRISLKTFFIYSYRYSHRLFQKRNRRKHSTNYSITTAGAPCFAAIRYSPNTASSNTRITTSRYVRVFRIYSRVCRTKCNSYNSNCKTP